jgi:long-chain fatty acid transport protein
VPPPALWAGYGTKISDYAVGFGAGMTVSHGGNVYWPSDWPGRFQIITVDRKVYAFAATGGVEVLPQLRLGGGPVYYYTTEYLKQQVDYLTSEGPGEISTSGGMFSYDLAAEITPVVGFPFTIGVDYKHQAVQKLSGNGHYSNVPPALQNSLLDQNVTHVLTIPNELHVALAWRPAKEWLVAFDYTLDRYSVYKDDTFLGQYATSCPSASCIVVPRNYGDGHTYRLAGEYTVSPRWEVRAGVERDLSGLKTDTYSPSLPDGNAWVIAGGASWAAASSVWLNLGLFYALNDKVTATGAAFPGSYDTSHFLVAFSVGWKPLPAAK